MASTPTRPKPPDGADAWLDIYCDGQVVRVEEEVKPGADLLRIRSAQAQSLRDALSGRYLPGGVQRPLDLTEQWWVLRVLLAEGSDYAGLGGGPLNASPEDLRSVRSLLEAALAHISETDDTHPVTKVPNVIGQQLARAVEILATAGLTANTEPLTQSSGDPKVVRQSPKGGTFVQRGSAVALGS
jgi:hypothetical protein